MTTIRPSALLPLVAVAIAPVCVRMAKHQGEAAQARHRLLLGSALARKLLNGCLVRQVQVALRLARKKLLLVMIRLSKRLLQAARSSQLPRPQAVLAAPP